MKQKLIFLSTLFIFSALVIQAQPNQRSFSKAKLTIKGQIVDETTSQGLEFATVSFYSKKDSSLVDGCLTQTDGYFTIDVNKTELYAKIEFISYSPKVLNDITIQSGKEINLGVILLAPESEILEDIEIVAERSETVFALDKKIFTVGKDLGNRGGSAEDILDNVPSVTVDIDGNVSLRGSQGVRILINGRPSGLAGVGNTNGLRNIPANLIEKVEVITNPSARYEAEGMAGIINIVLKKNQAGGFNGSFDVTAGYPLRNGVSANLNYRKNNINWFLNYGVNYNTNPGGGESLQDRLLTNEDNILERQVTLQDRTIDRDGLSNSIRFGLDYFFSEKEQFTASLVYRVSDDNNLGTLIFEDYLADENAFGIDPLWNSTIDNLPSLSIDQFRNDVNPSTLYNRITRTDTETEDEENLEYSVNYRKEFTSREHTLNVNVQFREKGEREFSDLVNNYTENLPGSRDTEIQRSDNDENENTWLFTLDYIHPFSKDHKFETGVLSSLRNINNDYIVQETIDGVLTPIADLTNNFDYDENVHAGYFIYGNTFNKFSYQAGLRGEYSEIITFLTQESITNDRTYFNLFPSGFLNYNFSEKSALQMSYSRRIRRPRFWDLNPFFTFSDNRNFFSGNPNIDPEYTDSYEIGQLQYIGELSINSSIFYRATQSTIQRVSIIDRFAASTLRVPINVGNVHDYGIDISINYSGLKWLRVDGNWNIFNNQLVLNQGESEEAVFNYYRTVRGYQGTPEEFNNLYDFSINETNNITWNGRLTFRFTFWDSDLQVRTNYRGARDSAQGRRNGIGSLDLGWSKDFLESKNLTITLSVRDVFNSRRRNGVTLFDNFYQQSEFQWRSRQATVTASYRINQKKKRGRPGGQGGYEGGGEF